MMNKVIIVTLLLIYSCTGDKNNDAVQSKKAEVMKIHDDAMDKMGIMIKLKTNLKTKLTEDTTNSASIKKAIIDLEDADQLMWDWMHNYHHEIVDTSSNEEALKYLNIQMQKVLEVESQINNSIKNGEELL